MIKLPESRCAAHLAIAFASFSVVASAAPQPTLFVSQVSITELGTLGGQQSVATDINENGSIAGWSETSQGVQHAFLYSNGLMQDISHGLVSRAKAINDSGLIAGTAEVGVVKHAFQFNSVGGGLGPLFPGPWVSGPQVGSDAFGVNSSGKIVGLCIVYQTSQLARAAFFSMPGPCTPLESTYSPYWSTANDINDANFIVGYTVGYARMRRWQWITPGGVTQGVHVPVPPTYSQSGGEAYGINNRGEVVGYVVKGNTPSVHRAYYWDGIADQSVDLGLLPGGKYSEAHEVSEGRFIVGFADASTSFPGLPIKQYWVSGFLFHADLGMYALPALPGMNPVHVCHAYGLNEMKRITKTIDIVGYCEADGKKRAVRWSVKILPLT